MRRNSVLSGFSFSLFVDIHDWTEAKHDCRPFSAAAELTPYTPQRLKPSSVNGYDWSTCSLPSHCIWPAMKRMIPLKVGQVPAAIFTIWLAPTREGIGKTWHCISQLRMFPYLLKWFTGGTCIRLWLQRKYRFTFMLFSSNHCNSYSANIPGKAMLSAATVVKPLSYKWPCHGQMRTIKLHVTYPLGLEVDWG